MIAFASVTNTARRPCNQWAMFFLLASLLCNPVVSAASDLSHLNSNEVLKATDKVNSQSKAIDVLKAYISNPGSTDSKNHLRRTTKKDRKKKDRKKKDRKDKFACALSVAHQLGWSNWLKEVETYAPVFRVKTDDELRSIIEKSKENGCRVRMMGATHSEDGMVMQRREEGVVIVSLVDHAPEDVEWGPSLDKESARVRLTAGMSWYEASRLIRPHGFVFRQRTAGRLFSVGGVIANMVHGGGSQYGFIHDEVTKMLVMKSDGTIMEVQGDDLKYWRSSGGQLGVVLSVEMIVHSESNPYGTFDPQTFQSVVDETKGGLNMKRKTVSFASLLPDPPMTPTPTQVSILMQNITEEVFTTVASSDHHEIFYNWYTNELTAYYTDYSGDRFSGADGPFPSQEKANLYQQSANDLVAAYPDAAFSGGDRLSLFGEQELCDILCEPPTGPLGDGSECDRFQSTTEPPPKLLCEVPLEVAALFTTLSFDILNAAWDQSKATINDGYFLTESTEYDTLILMAPTRVFTNAFLTWWVAHGQSVSGAQGFMYAGTAPFEFRFINPTETAIMNPVPTVNDMKMEFDANYPFVPDAFDTFFPEIPGIPDGIMAMEVNSLKGIFDDNFDQWFGLIQSLWQNMPAIPSVQYGDNPVPGQAEIVPDCDPTNGVFPCIGSTTVPGTFTESGQSSSGKCCVPKIPVKMAHLGKGWGYGFDQETTPVTGKLVPFSDSDIIENMYSTGKQSSISDFNAKIEELESEVFTGGALQRFLSPSRPNTDFEPRKLVGQTCGSSAFSASPNAECISSNCDENVLVCKDADDTSNKLKGNCVTGNRCGTPEYGSCCEGFGCRKTANKSSVPFGECCAKEFSLCTSNQDCCATEFGEELRCEMKMDDFMGEKHCVKNK